jgi:serine/threonine protein kinase
MDHPHIAKVLDASSTSSGGPYFVMELVKGMPITRFCDEQKLSVRQRLELFVPVCQAIQHAHQKGIIHRDIKPSNVLVALYDGQPVPKVIDFGLAKAMGPVLTDRTLFTGIGMVLGTLEYMSPEQAEVNQLDIDTRSDLYSLGVLLYELLTGTTPLRRESVRQGALDEVLRRIREEESPRPSTRLSETKESLPAISAQRRLEPAQLLKLLRGDLDWIVMKALRDSQRVGAGCAEVSGGRSGVGVPAFDALPGAEVYPQTSRWGGGGSGICSAVDGGIGGQHGVRPLGQSGTGQSGRSAAACGSADGTGSESGERSEPKRSTSEGIGG